MIQVSLYNINLFEIIDEATSETFYGGWQEWYGVWWKRLAGCGPTVVSTIISYLSRRKNAEEAEALPVSKNDFQMLMEDIWQYVTPSVRGIPTTAALIKGAGAYIGYKGLDIRLEELDIHKNKLLRPAFTTVLEYLSSALAADAPVAFLSLDKGEEELLDTWHWVALLSLEYEADGSSAYADIVDEGKLLHVDLKKWYRTTSLGGGFVRFMPQQ